MSENAPYHSIYFGRPCSAPSSIKSKSKTRLRAAIPTTNNENPIVKRNVPTTIKFFKDLPFETHYSFSIHQL